MDICYNHITTDGGWCDFCDARCPSFIDVKELMCVLRELKEGGSEDAERAMLEAHNRTLKRIDEEYVKSGRGNHTTHDE